MTTYLEERSAYGRRRRRLLAAGEWETPVDAQPVTQHITDLRRRGVSLQTIADAARLNISTLTPLAYPDTHSQARRYTLPPTAHAILAVTFETAAALSPFIPAVGTRRRIEALQWMGWPQAELARRLGVTTQAVGQIKHNARINVHRAASIDTLYRELCMTPGPDAKARTWARKRGFAPPLAWENIDDPSESPNLGGDDTNEPDRVVIERLLAGRPTTVPVPDRPAVVRVLASRGLSDGDIARLIGVWGETVLRIRHRHGIPAGVPIGTDQVHRERVAA